MKGRAYYWILLWIVWKNHVFTYSKQRSRSHKFCEVWYLWVFVYSKAGIKLISCLIFFLIFSTKFFNCSTVPIAFLPWNLNWYSSSSHVVSSNPRRFRIGGKSSGIKPFLFAKIIYYWDTHHILALFFTEIDLIFYWDTHHILHKIHYVLW